MYEDVEYQDENDGHHEEIVNELSKINLLLQENTKKQDKIFQKLSSRNDITNNSMDALRSAAATSKVETAAAHDIPPWSMVWSKLVEIKSELILLQQQRSASKDDESSDLEEKLRTTLLSTDETIQEVRKLAGIIVDEEPDASDEKGCGTMNEEEDDEEEDISTKLPASIQTNIQEDSPGNGQPVEAEESDAPEQADTSLSVQDSLIKLVEQNELDVLRIGTQLLYLYVVNLATHSENPRYQKIYTNNDNFQKISALKGAEDLLRSVGFEQQKDEDYFEWLPSKENECTERKEEMKESLGKAASALVVIKSCKDKENLLEDVLARMQWISIAPALPENL